MDIKRDPRQFVESSKPLDQHKYKGWYWHYPTKKFCTDNGAMIAYAGYKKHEAGQIYNLHGEVKPRWPLDKLNECLNG